MEVNGQLYALTTYPWRKAHSTCWIWGWVAPRRGLYALDKR